MYITRFGLYAAASPAILFLYLFPGLHFTCSGLYAIGIAQAAQLRYDN